MSTIIGLGLDATDIPRIAATMERYGDRFIQRIFTDGEIAYCSRRRVPAIHFAGRFAAKEAAMKALRVGDRAVSWREVEVQRAADGAPTLVLRGAAAALAAEAGLSHFALSVTHERTYASAIVVASA